MGDEEEEFMEEEVAEEEVAEEEVAEEVEDEEVAAEEAVEEEQEAPKRRMPKMIQSIGYGKHVVRLRQRLKADAEMAAAFVEQLNTAIEEHQSSGEALVFEDFDISQNSIPTEQWEGLFSALQDGNVTVERFRAFGCPTLDDTAMTLLAGWLSLVTESNMPFEMHLSDCAITSIGYEDLIRALTENDAFPGPDPKNPEKGKLPLYLRLEHNYIADDVLQKSIDDEVVIKMNKTSRPFHSDSYKVRLLVREDGKFQQRDGDPPAPEDAPPPRPVKGKDKGKGKGDRKGDRFGDRRGDRFGDRDRDRKGDRKGDRDRGKGGSDRDRKGKGGGSSTPPWAALPASRTGSGKSDGRSSASSRNSTTTRESSRPFNAFSKGDSRGRADNNERNSSGGKSAGKDKSNKRPGDSKDDRASKVQRSEGKAGGKAGGKKKGAGLPFPWEEHWSDEYNLTYFWNSKTGASTWERPRA